MIIKYEYNFIFDFTGILINYQPKSMKNLTEIGNFSFDLYFSSTDQLDLV